MSKKCLYGGTTIRAARANRITKLIYMQRSRNWAGSAAADSLEIKCVVFA